MVVHQHDHLNADAIFKGQIMDDCINIKHESSSTTAKLLFRIETPQIQFSADWVLFSRLHTP
jgi:hypothetical protein